MTRKILGMLVALTALAWATSGLAAEKRVALIIGNAAYRQGVPKLANPANDARAIDRALKDVGFTTTLKLDATRREIYAAVKAFAGELDAGAIGLFYYAGHGIQADGRNYLLPVDAEIDSEDDLRAEAVDVGEVLRAMDEARNPLNIVILDACRDNPLPKTRSALRGLARIEAPRGTFIAYAAGPGEAARDGPAGGNGIFTGEFLAALAQPGLKIEDVFKRVANGVAKKTSGKQTPWTESSFLADFYFRPAAENPGPADNAVELEFWKSIVNSSDPADFGDYLKRYPDGDFASLARRKQLALAVPKPPEPPAPPLVAIAVVPRPAADALRLNGVVEAGRSVTVSSSLSGFIREVLAIEGSTVAAGAVLARFDEHTAAPGGPDRDDRLTGDLNQYVSTTPAPKMAPLAMREVRAPIAGVVVRAMVETGNLAMSGQGLFVIGDPRSLNVSAPTGNDESRRLRKGERALIASPAQPGANIAATITEVSPRRVAIALPPGTALRVGAAVTVEIAASGEAMPILVPAAAVRGGAAFVVEGDIARRRVVQTGAARDGSVEVRSGLAPGDRLITDPPPALVDGTSVRVAPEAK